MKLTSVPIAFLAALLAPFIAFNACGQSPAPSSSTAYTFSTFDGRASSGSADGVGSAALFNQPSGTAVDANGNIYVADSANNTIRRITPSGLVTTIAGFPGAPGNTDGTNNAARFNDPAAIAMDNLGNLFIADSGNGSVREASPVGTNWVISTLPNIPFYVGTNTFFLAPGCVAEDGLGNLYVTSAGGRAIKSEDKASGIAGTNYAAVNKLTLAGTNWVIENIFSEIEATNFTFANPLLFNALGADRAGNIYLSISNTIEEMTPVGTNWMTKIIAGVPGVAGSTDGTNISARFNRVLGIAADNAGNLFVSDGNSSTIRRLTPSGTNWITTTIAGAAGHVGFANGTGTNASFDDPAGIAVDRSGALLYAADFQNNTIRRITILGVVETLAGSASSAGSTDGLPTDAEFNNPLAITQDAAGNVYVADELNATIRQITPFGQVNTIAGTAGISGPLDGVGGYAQFGDPRGVALDGVGNLFVADFGNSTIREVTPEGLVSTIAGQTYVYDYADGLGTNALFNNPVAITADGSGDFYVTDFNPGIRKLTPVGTNWMVSTLSVFDEDTQSNAFFGGEGIAADDSGHLFVTADDVVREVFPLGSNWVVFTIAGSFQDDTVSNAIDADGIGTNALFSGISGITIDGAGNLYVTESGELYQSGTGGQVIRKLTFDDGNWVVTTIGGLSGVASYANGVGGFALFNAPAGISSDKAGNLFISDSGNNVIRRGVSTQYGAANPTPYSHPNNVGALQVTLVPPEANGQWRFAWEQVWHNSGDTASNLVEGQYPVEFRNLPGWLPVPMSFVGTNSISISAGTTYQLTNTYYPTELPSGAGSESGTLEVFLGTDPPAGAGWRFVGSTNGTPYFPSGFAVNLLPGTYLIEFAGPFSGRATPPNGSVQVTAGRLTQISVVYSIAPPPPANVLLPVPVPPNETSDVTTNPFGFNGQILSDVGYASGAVVASNVVLTAAHVVFNDETLSSVSGAFFFLQQETPSYAPSPLTARGWYVLSGYAAQRTNDINTPPYGPDISSPQSRNLDVAALYFNGPVAGGGYGGFLPSDDVPNQWLTGNAEKMLVGYPIDGSLYGFTDITNGVMYEIGPQPYPLTLDSESVTNQQEVYDASWFLSYPGNSGGPLYVLLNGYYYPAGVYLGTVNNQSVVRGIDSGVTNLIFVAATLGDAGTNNTGGGPVPIIPDALISASNPGYLQINLQPPSAVLDGAGWQLAGDSAFGNAPTYTRLVNNAQAAVLFNPINGWLLPTNQTIAVTPGQSTNVTAVYTLISPRLVANAQGIGLSGASNTTYRIEYASSLSNISWTGLGTNTITNADFSLVVPRPVKPATIFYRAVWLGR